MRTIGSDKKAGHDVLTFDSGGLYAYSCIPLESASGWYLLSIVPLETVETDVDKMMAAIGMSLVTLLFLPVICGALFLLTRNSNKEIVADIRGVNPTTDTAEIQEFLRQLRTLRPGESAGPVIREQIHTLTGEHQCLLERAACVCIQNKVKVMVYVSDRTRECRLREDLADALRRAQYASNAKSVFLKNISRDMRTPMNAIIGFLGLMRGEVNKPDAVMEYNHRIDTASQHLLGLINNVLDMSRIESGNMILNVSELSVAEIVEEIRTIFTPQVQAKNQTFDISASQLMHEYLLGDKVRIKEILLNILSNAMKYTPEGGAIYLRVEELPQAARGFSRLRFEIEDNGAGMSQDYQRRLFSPFSREESQTNLETQGYGLGLAITKSLIDLMGGDIRLKVFFTHHFLHCLKNLPPKGRYDPSL